VLLSERVQEIVSSSDFLSFFDRSTKLVECALCAPYDVFVDYSQEDGSNDLDGLTSGDVRLNTQFQSARYTANRAITCMDWSIKHPELLVASYNANEDAPNEPDGIVLVWNMHLKD
jgi:dynein intermediate chain